MNIKSSSSIIFFAIIGKENEPLFLKNYVNEKYQIDFEFLSFSALDFVEEKQKASGNLNVFLGQYKKEL